MYGKQKIKYTHLFKYYDKNGLVKVTPATEQSSRESAESVVNEFDKDSFIVRIEKVNLNTKQVESWDRKEFIYDVN